MREKITDSSHQAAEKESLLPKKVSSVSSSSTGTHSATDKTINNILNELFKFEDNFDPFLDQYAHSTGRPDLRPGWNYDLSLRESLICHCFYQALDYASGNKLSGAGAGYNAAHQNEQLLQALRYFYRATGDYGKHDQGLGYFCRIGLFFGTRKIGYAVENICSDNQVKITKLLNLRKEIEAIIDHLMQQPESVRWAGWQPSNAYGKR